MNIPEYDPCRERAVELGLEPEINYPPEKEEELPDEPPEGDEQLLEEEYE